MVIHMVLLKLLDWVLYQLLANSCYRAARKMRSYGFLLKNPSLKSPNQQLPQIFADVSKCPLNGRESHTLVCDINGTLLRSDKSFFPYFMLVAFEGGSILRAFLLLLSCPLLWALEFEYQLRVMIFITFFGLKIKDVESVSRTVLPKFYLENLHLQAYEVLASTGSKVIITSIPRVMVEGFLKEYLSVNKVIGTELHTVGKYFSGFLCNSGLVVKHKALKHHFADKTPQLALGISTLHDYLFISLCKEGYVVNKEEKNKGKAILPREKYPKALIFHDGRLAFLPTPLAALSMFVWLPFGFCVAILRLLIGIHLPYKVAVYLGTKTGVRIITKGISPNCIRNPPSPSSSSSSSSSSKKGVLYVCTHRTLLDPVFLSTCLGKPLTAVTYSLSKMSEIIAPIKTVRLSRERKRDAETMEKLLREGDLVVCPEGTTCREPYLLRFSSLFAELADEIVPVGVNTRVSMFYGTTASGLKCLDPIYFLMNPTPVYELHFLEKLPKEMSCGGGRSSTQVANYIQKQLAIALGFQCTTLTRRDKYLMLAGNEGIVPHQHHHNSSSSSSKT